MVILPALLQGCSNWGTDADLRFAKTAFQSLANGYASAEKVIDWETFASMGETIAKDYGALPNDTEKEAFRKSFIMSFSTSFQSSGGSVDSMKNWRILDRDKTKTIVAADIPNNRMIVVTIIKRNGENKISVLEVKNL
jgi:hypothetical protein